MRISDWSSDVCSSDLMLKNMTFPGQVSFGTIFPKEVDNLMVTVCLSSSHIGWGTIRLEPTWMSICEAAGYAAALAISQQTVTAHINPEPLTRDRKSTRLKSRH